MVVKCLQRIKQSCICYIRLQARPCSSNTFKKNIAGVFPQQLLIWIVPQLAQCVNSEFIYGFELCSDWLNGHFQGFRLTMTTFFVDRRRACFDCTVQFNQLFLVCHKCLLSAYWGNVRVRRDVPTVRGQQRVCKHDELHDVLLLQSTPVQVVQQVSRKT